MLDGILTRTIPLTLTQSTHHVEPDTNCPKRRDCPECSKCSNRQSSGIFFDLGSVTGRSLAGAGTPVPVIALIGSFARSGITPTRHGSNDSEVHSAEEEA